MSSPTRKQPQPVSDCRFKTNPRRSRLVTRSGGTDSSQYPPFKSNRADIDCAAGDPDRLPSAGNPARPNLTTYAKLAGGEEKNCSPEGDPEPSGCCVRSRTVKLVWRVRASLLMGLLAAATVAGEPQPVAAPPTLFAYEATKPLQLRDRVVEIREYATVHDITYLSTDGNTISAYLVSPKRRGPFAAARSDTGETALVRSFSRKRSSMLERARSRFFRITHGIGWEQIESRSTTSPTRKSIEHLCAGGD